MLDLFSPAGAAMYEHALRLGQEVSGLDSLQKQVCFFDIFAVKFINDLGSSLALICKEMKNLVHT